MRRRYLLIAAALPLLTTLGWATTAASAQTARAEADNRARLEAIRAERARLREGLIRIRSQVSDASAEMANLRQQVAASARLLAELTLQVNQKQAEIDSTAQALAATQQRLAERRLLLKRRLRDLYKTGPLEDVQVLLGARSFSDLINRYKYLYLVAQRDRALLADVDRLRNQLVLRGQELQRALSGVRYLQQERALEYAQVQGTAVQQSRTLTSLQVRERAALRRSEQLAADERRMNLLVATLERRRREADRAAAPKPASRGAHTEGADAAASAPARLTGSTGPATATLTVADRGTLAWPVSGRVLYRFGRAAQPNGTVIRWNGVGIAAAAGTPVRAIEGGTVVVAAPFEGYGPTVVISHGGGYYSLYLYLRDISVRQGASVVRGQSVGTVGGERTPEGAHIEFQIRTPGGQAVDPLTWLRR